MFCICGGGSPDNHTDACLEQELRYHYPKMSRAEIEKAIADDRAYAEINADT